MNSTFILLIFLIGGAVIFALYYLFFPAESSDKIKKEKGDRVQVLNEQIRKGQQEIDSMSVRLIEAKKCLESKEEEFKSISAVLEDLKRQVQASTDQKAILERKAGELSEQVVKAIEEKDGLNNKIRSLQDSISNFEEKLKLKDEELKKITDKLKEEKENILKKEDFMQKKIQDSESKLNQIMEDLRIKEDKVKSYEVKIAELSAQKQGEKKVEDMEKKIQDYESKINEMSCEKQTLEEQIVKKEEENRKVRQDIDSELSRQKEEFLKKAEELNNQILLLQGELDTIREKGEGEETKLEVRGSKGEENGQREGGNPDDAPIPRGDVGAGGQEGEETTPIADQVPVAGQVNEEVTESKQINEGELSERQKQILEYLKEHKKITRKECIDKFGVSVPTAGRDLKELQDRGLIKPYGPMGPGRYFILS